MANYNKSNFKKQQKRKREQHSRCRDRGIEHLEMYSLQSDFSRHSLINLLGPAELRVFIHFLTKYLKYPQRHSSDSTVLKQSSGPTPSGSLEVDSGRLNLPMSLNSSPNALFSCIFCCGAISVLEMLWNGKWCGKNYRFSFYLVCDEIE